MMTKRTRRWILGSLVSSLVLLQGCESGSVLLGGNFDLAEYLFPNSSGKFIYKHFTAQKPKGEESFTKPEYQEDVQCDVARNGDAVTVVNRKNDLRNKTYTVSSGKIAVLEEKEKLTYHFDRRVDRVANFVQEETIKTGKEKNGESRIVYECNATAHKVSMTVEPNPAIFENILKVECVQKHIISATVGGKKFETVDEKKEEAYYAKDKGMIQSTVTRCEYTQVDDAQQPPEGCTQDIYKMWAFFAE